MKERPILMSAPMVCATLDDRKTQTRRVMKSQPVDVCHVIGFSGNNWGYLQQTGLAIDDHAEKWIPCPYEVGMRLWVRETWCPLDAPDHFADPSKPKDFMIYGRRNGAAYRAECNDAEGERCRKELGYRWRPSIFMPRWASRITLEITEVRVERLQEISEEDARAEGVRPVNEQVELLGEYRIGYVKLWDSLNAKRGLGWDKNPWVWVIGFKRVTI